MARSTHDTTEIYRALIRYRASWCVNGESTSIYGPYDGPSGKGQARRRLKDQHGTVLEGRVQKLTCRHDGNGPELEWVDVDD